MHNSGKDMFQKYFLALLTLLLIFCAKPIIVNASADDSIIFDSTNTNEVDIVNHDAQLEVSEDEYNFSEYMFSDNLIENTLTATLYGAVGKQGFFGEYAINDPHETVEVIVQFVTPPAVALRLLQEERYFGSAPIVDFDEQALIAHTTFLHQLRQIEVPFFRRHLAPQIFSQHHQLFNGVYMRISGGLVEQIANLPEVYAVFPHVLPKVPDAVDHFDIDFIQNKPEIMASTYYDNVRVVLLDTGIDHSHPELNRYLDETGRIPGWQYFYEPGTERDNGTQTASEIVSISPEIELWSIQKGTNCGPGVVSIDALETAVKLEADVIYTFGINEHPHALAVSLAVLDGHNVVTANDTSLSYVSYTFDWGIEDVNNLEGEVRYDTPPSLPSLGDIPPNPGYRFNGWNPVVGPITEDTTFEARWKEVYVENYVEYIFDWGIENVDNPKGKAVYNSTPQSLPSLGDIPSNPGYRFDGWTPPVGLITEDTTFKARWIPADVAYTFDWGVEDVNNITGEVEHNSVPSVPARESVPENPGYQFNGWEPRVGPVTTSTTFNAIWIPRYVEYTFDWRLEDVSNPSAEIRDNTLPNLPTEIPENPGYQFNGWTPLLEPLSDNTIFNAVWIPIDIDNYNYVTYTFDWGIADKANPKGLIRHDSTPVAPGAIPINPGFDFDGWSPRVNSIEEDTIFTANWIPNDDFEDDWYEIVAIIEPTNIDDDSSEILDDEVLDETNLDADLDDDNELDDNNLDDNAELDEDEDLDNEDLDEDDLNNEALDEYDPDYDELGDYDLDNGELDESFIDDDEYDLYDDWLDWNNNEHDDYYFNDADLNDNNDNFLGNDYDEDNDHYLYENDFNNDESNEYIGEDIIENNDTNDEPIYEAPRPGSRARPTLPQTGAIAGVSVLAGSSLAASGLVVASVKNKVMQNKLVQKRTSSSNAALDQRLEDEYRELFGN